MHPALILHRNRQLTDKRTPSPQFVGNGLDRSKLRNHQPTNKYTTSL